MKYVSPEDYRESVNRVMRFLSGYDDGAEKILSEKGCRRRRRTVRAGDRVPRPGSKCSKKLRERTVANLGAVTDIDAYAYAFDGNRGVISVAIVRGNKLIGVQNFAVSDGSP